MGRSQKNSARVGVFAALEPRTCNVSKAVVKKKWKKLSTTSQEDVSNIITSVRKQSAMVKSKGTKAAFDSSIVLEEVANRLNERLPRMPVPPATSDENFDFELTLHRIQTLEQQLTDNQHTMNILRAQIKKEETQLSMDKKEVECLQENIKSNDAIRSKQLKNLHSLFRSISEPLVAPTSPTRLCFDNARNGQSSTGILKLPKDETLLPILQQLRDHLSSMQTNTTNMQALVTCMQSTSYSLQTAMFREAMGATML